MTMATARRPSIAPLVTGFESAIQENRKKGYDKDLTGRVSNCKPVYNPERVRRLSELFPPPEKKQSYNKELFNSDGTLRVKLRKLADNARQRCQERQRLESTSFGSLDEPNDVWLLKKKVSFNNDIDESVTGTTEEETITTEEAYDLLHGSSTTAISTGTTATTTTTTTSKRYHKHRVSFGKVPLVIETHSDDANEDSADVSEVASEALMDIDEGAPHPPQHQGEEQSQSFAGNNALKSLPRQQQQEQQPSQRSPPPPPSRDALRASFVALMESADSLSSRAEKVPKPKRKSVKKTKPSPTAAAPRPPPPVVTILTEEEQAEDPEIQALLARIQRLQGDYQAVQDREAEDLKKVERTKKMQMARFWQKRSVKRWNPNELSKIDLEEPAMKQREKQFSKVQADIQLLRDENRQLRKRCVDYAQAMLQLKQENSQLELDQSTMQSYLDELKSFSQSQEIKHRRASAVVPQYQSKVEIFEEEAENRDAWAQMENRILGHYKQYELKIIEMIEYRCDDSDLVEDVVRLHLGLDPIPE